MLNASRAWRAENGGRAEGLAGCGDQQRAWLGGCRGAEALTYAVPGRFALSVYLTQTGGNQAANNNLKAWYVPSPQKVKPLELSQADAMKAIKGPKGPDQAPAANHRCNSCMPMGQWEAFKRTFKRPCDPGTLIYPAEIYHRELRYAIRLALGCHRELRYGSVK